MFQQELLLEYFLGLLVELMSEFQKSPAFQDVVNVQNA